MTTESRSSAERGKKIEAEVEQKIEDIHRWKDRGAATGQTGERIGRTS